jgi:hypothetical protein
MTSNKTSLISLLLLSIILIMGSIQLIGKNIRYIKSLKNTNTIDFLKPTYRKIFNLIPPAERLGYYQCERPDRTQNFFIAQYYFAPRILGACYYKSLNKECKTYKYLLVTTNSLNEKTELFDFKKSYTESYRDNYLVLLEKKR